MSCLTTIQSVARRIGLPAPNAVVTSSDPQVLQLLEFANSTGKDLVAQYDWNFGTANYTFTTIVGVEIQIANLATILLSPGVIGHIPPADLHGISIINNTIWNQSLRRPVYGPLSAQDWEQQKAAFTQSPWNQFRIFGNALHFLPVPADKYTCTFEYTLNTWVFQASFSNSIPYPTMSGYSSDADESAIEEEIIALGAIWRWKQAKGLAYAEDMASFERRAANAMTKDGTKAILNMGDSYDSIIPGVFVPAGSWF